MNEREALSGVSNCRKINTRRREAVSRRLKFPGWDAVCLKRDSLKTKLRGTASVHIERNIVVLWEAARCGYYSTVAWWRRRSTAIKMRGTMSQEEDSCPRLISRRQAEEEEDEDEEEDREWMSSFCGCLADPSSCLLTTACPCVGAGVVAQKLDGGRTHWLAGSLVWLVLQGTTTFGCLYSCHYRRKLRKRYNLRRSPLPDTLVHWIFWPCAICQELRELKARETTYYGFGEDDDRLRFAAPRPQIMGRQ